MDESQGRPDLQQILTTNHPARPYFVGGGVLALLGLLRGGSLHGLGFLGLGGLLIAKGLQEVRQVEELHGGNYHGVNAPPSNR